MSMESGNQSDQHWHLDKRINVGHLGTTMSIVVAAMIWGSSVETRLSLAAQERSQQTRLLSEIRDEQKGLNRKLDALLVKIYEGRSFNGHAQ